MESETLCHCPQVREEMLEARVVLEGEESEAQRRSKVQGARQGHEYTSRAQDGEAWEGFGMQTAS